MTAAQKAAKENFSKAIAYRTKTGVSLKEAFAHVYGRKVGTVKKKAAPNKKAAVKKAAQKKKAVPKKKAGLKKQAPVKVTPIKTTVKKYNSVTTVSGLKKAAVKKVTETHKDNKSHNVNIKVMSEIKRDMFVNYLDPKSVLNEILYFQDQVVKQVERLKYEKNAKIKPALREFIKKDKIYIALNKKRLKELLNILK
jgi:hypothetical protein